MAIRTALWKVSAQPQALIEAQLPSEKLLEDMIVAAPKVLSDEWMLIGRQESTDVGGIIDLLAVAPDGSLVLIELKRDRTPRDVVAQALDYAGWVEKLKPEDIAAIYGRFAPGKNLAAEFQEAFGLPLDEDTLNQSHQIVIVSSSLDPSTERIVAYLADRDIPINVLCFQIFSNGNEQILSRAWLLDPVHTQTTTRPVGKNEPWNGEFYHSFGHSNERSWDDAVKYGFISAGGGRWYSNTLQLLGKNDRVWAKVPGAGFVGVGRVKGPVQSIQDFVVQTEAGEKSILEVGHATYLREWMDDPDRCEYFVPVEWLQTVPISQAVHEVGMFGNQNSVCKPTTPKWRTTVERLKEHFPRSESKD
ncbi:endonuclease NucS [Aromatoleum toluclasticum]|uniref:endonuclease NucS domain-containing protein n=1 Tax=Aromatoleum toluclasticum TaxID=92003 RepID=UPI001D18E8AF|nr:endonuclease NucS domain-containing protein [Aromatoleum toluclasticum]MCC4118616.1 endonuclease NucS [Aromatoleum toluclasticum]